MITPVLLFLSAPPKLLSQTLVIAGPERTNTYLFVVLISNLHCHNDDLCGRKYRNLFCDIAVTEYEKAANALGKSHPYELTVFPAFVKKNLELIRAHLGEGKGKGWENPYMTEEDVFLFGDFVAIFLEQCEKKEKKHPVCFDLFSFSFSFSFSSILFSISLTFIFFLHLFFN